MSCEAVLTESAHREASTFLLRHVREGRMQEELCFALWRLSSGATRKSALIFDIVPPIDGDHHLHGNVSFEPRYLARAVRLACSRETGLAFMHNHFSDGWQDMSDEDVIAERDRISPAARATGFPLVGLTLAVDGSWSARFWMWDGKRFNRSWCDKVRVVGRRLDVTFNDDAIPPPRRRPILRRTIDTWGDACQQDLARLRVGVVGVGSVGCVVAEMLARIGIENLVLVDPDRVELHNLDRLLYAGTKDVGCYKVDVASKHLRNSATAEHFRVRTHKHPIQYEKALRAAMDCDVLFSAVDRPLPKDLLNRIAYAHCIPVISGGVFIDTKPDGTLGQATWSVLTVGPSRRCLRCDGQYTTSDVTLELDGSLDEPTYIRSIATAGTASVNQNVFPLSVNLASFMVIEMVRLTVGASWWPDPGGKLHYSLIPNRLHVERTLCGDACSVCESTAHGDQYTYPFILRSPPDRSQFALRTLITTIRTWILRAIRATGRQN